MNQLTNQLLSSLKSLASSIKTFRRKHGVSLNQLSKLSGISRRTLTRIEAGFYSSHESQATGRGSPAVRSPKGVGGRHLSPRIAYRLAQLLLPPDRFQQMLQRATEQPYPFNLLPDPYPLFLFHHSPPAIRRQFEQEFAPDYSGAFFRLILMPERNLAQRLRAFRLQHGFTLKDTACLLDLSLSHLHALESGQRSPSPRTRFKLLRFLTLPFPNRDSSERDTRSYRQQHLDALKALLTIPPPEPIELIDDSDRLHRLRYLWLTSRDSTRHLAARLDISQPHLIRLLRGDRRPSRSLRQRLELLTAPSCLSCLS